MDRLACFKAIEVFEPKLRDRSVESRVTVHDLEGNPASFDLQFRYEKKALPGHLPFYRMAAAMPFMNYGLFTEKLKLQYPLSDADISLLGDLLDIFSKDIFINKIARRRANYIPEEFLPRPEEVTEENARPVCRITCEGALEADMSLAETLEPNSCGVLSSGGKESLLTYAMLKELGADIHPIYVNESGGHWRTAITAYRHHMATEPNTARVWTNLDRLYLFMLDNMRIIRRDHRRVKADTYPIRLCIFPVYVFMLLPVFAARGVGNLLIGSEFDDPRLEPVYNGIRHYFGVYDQTQDFDLRMEEWYAKRLPGMRQWSTVRPISGLIVERALVSRYPQQAALQRSCHSCHLEGLDVVPCGKCSKCLGILLFMRANGTDPAMMAFRPEDVEAFPERLAAGGLRLDRDEREHAAYLAGRSGHPLDGAKKHTHIDCMHLHAATSDISLFPERFRRGLLDILRNYTDGFRKLDEEGLEWVECPADGGS